MLFFSPSFQGTIPPLLKTGDPISDNMSGSGGLKMVVTITSILVVAVLVFIMLMVLKRRRREQRLKRLRGGLWIKLCCFYNLYEFAFCLQCEV